MDPNTQPLASGVPASFPSAAPPPASSEHNKTLLEWTAPIVAHHERSPRWYLIGSILIIALTIYGILTGAWTMSLLAILLGGLYFLVRHEPPVLQHIEIQEHGFVYGGAFTFWTDCKDFWLIQCPGYTELHIKRKKGLNAETIIQTSIIDPILIRSTLSQYLEIRPDQKERFLDALLRIFKL